MDPDRKKRIRGIIALCLGGACVIAAYVGVSRCCPGSARSTHASVLKTLWGLLIFSPFIATQAIPLVQYYRARRSLIASVLSGMLMTGVLCWTYLLDASSMLHPGPLLGLTYPYAALFLWLAQGPALLWETVDRRKNLSATTPPRPD